MKALLALFLMAPLASAQDSKEMLGAMSDDRGVIGGAYDGSAALRDSVSPVPVQTRGYGPGAVAPEFLRLQRVLAEARRQPSPHWQRGLVTKEPRGPLFREERPLMRPGEAVAWVAEKGPVGVGMGVSIFLVLGPLTGLAGMLFGRVAGVSSDDEDETA
ncbi:MAG: hypothetical protein WC728_08865 [Elusimicrobiota bacterium]